MSSKKSPLEADPHGVEPDDETRAIDGAGAEPSFDALIGELSGLMGRDSADGWSGIDDAGRGLQKQRTAQMQAMKAEANIFRDTFSTPAGMKCLAIMREMTVDAEPFPSEAMLPIEAITPLVIAHVAICKFYRGIEQAIATAENREAKPRTVST